MLGRLQYAILTHPRAEWWEGGLNSLILHREHFLLERETKCWNSCSLHSLWFPKWSLLCLGPWCCNIETAIFAERTSKRFLKDNFLKSDTKDFHVRAREKLFDDKVIRLLIKNRMRSAHNPWSHSVRALPHRKGNLIRPPFYVISIASWNYSLIKMQRPIIKKQLTKLKWVCTAGAVRPSGFRESFQDYRQNISKEVFIKHSNQVTS